MAKVDFGGVVEEVITSEEFTLDEAREVLSKETVAVLGYGVQGPGQALNMRDNGIQVIVGQREGGASWDRAVADGFVPGQTLFPVEEAARRGTIIQYLLSDAGQSAMWPKIKACLNEGDALYFSHGFSVVYKEQTGVVPPANVDVILVAPKGSGTTVRRNFLDGSGINSSLPSSRILPATPGDGRWPPASPSAPAISSPPLSSAKSTATSPANAASSWGAWPASWKPSTTCCAKMATAPAKPSTRPWKN
jgi:hypothetical protein